MLTVREDWHLPLLYAISISLFPKCKLQLPLDLKAQMAKNNNKHLVTGLFCLCTASTRL